MAGLKGKPQPKGWHPQKATKHWLAYKAGLEEHARRSEDERARRDREEKAKTDYAKVARSKQQKGQ